MKSLIITIPPGTDIIRTKLDIISKQLDITSDKHRDLIYAIYTLFPAAFALNEATKGAILTQLGGKTTENNLNVLISRLIEKKALIRRGKLISLNETYINAVNSDQLVIRCK